MAPPSTTPNIKLTSGMFAKIVEIKVGSGVDRKTFMLHEGLLCYYSDYFKAALQGKFAEANKGVIELEEEDVSIFEQFVLWLYSQKFRRIEDEDEENFCVICNLWLFADRRQIPLLANTMIDALRDEVVFNWLVPTSELHNIWQHTTAESELRKFIIWIISNTSGPSICESRSSWPADAMWDIMKAVWELKQCNKKTLAKDTIANMDMCLYHQHEEGVNCAKPAK